MSEYSDEEEYSYSRNIPEITEEDKKLYQQNPALWIREFIWKKLEETVQPEKSSKKEKDEESEMLEQLKKSECKKKYFNYGQIKMCMVTYNCGEIVVPYNLFEKMLVIDEESKDYLLNNMIDFYFIVLEELDMNAKEFFRGRRFTDKTKSVFENLQFAFSKLAKSKYSLIDLSQLGGICMIGFMHKRMEKRVSDIRTGCENVGNLDLANKGGIAISFTIDGTSVCVVGSHLAAHQQYWERRNQDFQEIFNNIKLTPMTIMTQSLNCEISEKAKEAFCDRKMMRKEHFKRIKDCDIVFWMGDLNYRIDEDEEIVRKKIEDGTCYELVPTKDQLAKQRANGIPIVSEFHESEIKFMPTFKFHPNTDNYHSLRIPAYCDRILYRTKQFDYVKCWEYTSIPEVQQSDHKPVRGVFSFYPKNMRQKEKDIGYSLMFAESQLKDEFPTEIKVNCTHFHVDLFPSKVSSILLEITNVGKTSVTGRFICETENKKRMNPLKKTRTSKDSGERPEITDNWSVSQTSAVENKTRKSFGSSLNQSLKKTLSKTKTSKKRDLKKSQPAPKIIDIDDEEEIEIREEKDVSIPKWISISQEQIIIPVNDREPHKIEIKFKADTLFDLTRFPNDLFHETLKIQVKGGEEIPITIDFTPHKTTKEMDKYFDDDGFAKQMHCTVLAWQKLFPWGNFENIDPSLMEKDAPN